MKSSSIIKSPNLITSIGLINGFFLVGKEAGLKNQPPLLADPRYTAGPTPFSEYECINACYSF